MVGPWDKDKDRQVTQCGEGVGGRVPRLSVCGGENDREGKS